VDNRGIKVGAGERNRKARHPPRAPNPHSRRWRLAGQGTRLGVKPSVEQAEGRIETRSDDQPIQFLVSIRPCEPARPANRVNTLNYTVKREE